MNINRANLSCKNGPKRENRDKGQQLSSNGQDPFKKVEEGLKTRHFTVYNKSRICSQVRPKYDAKMGLQREIGDKW